MANLEMAEAQLASARPGNYPGAVDDAYGPGSRFRNRDTENQPDINKTNLLPKIDIIAFGQDTPSDTGGLWNGIRHMFGYHTTGNDLVKKDVESRMTADEQKELHKQESAYKDKWMQWATQANISGANHPPDMNDYPMLVKREMMVRQEEGEIARTVENKMTPPERLELKKEFEDYQKALNDKHWWTISTPEPGPAVKEYYKKIGEETERRVNGT